MRGATALWPLLLASAWAAGCKTAEVASHNLDQVLAPTNRFRYMADVQSGWGYYTRQLFNADFMDPDSSWASKELKPVKDPTDVTLENLLRLADKASYGDGFWQNAELARHFARYAAYCPSALGRERALIELGEIAQRMNLGDPLVEAVQGANAAELSEALAGLVDALRPILDGSDTGPTAQRDFVAACRLLERRAYDIEGGRRLLEVIASFSRKRRLRGEGFEPLHRLSLKVQKEIVGQALASGRVDPVPFVRAAGYEANWRAYGDRFLDEALHSLVLYNPQAAEGGALVTPVLKLPGVAPEHDEVFVATLDILATAGFPEHARGDALEARQNRFIYLRTLSQIAYDFSLYGDPTRTAAMLALERLSGSGMSSLREEDWARWWTTFGTREQAEIKRLREAAKQPVDQAAERPAANPAGDGAP